MEYFLYSYLHRFHFAGTEHIEIRDYADSRTIYPMPFLTNENTHLYAEAYDLTLMN